MIRNLVVIAVAGFVLCLAALSAAFAIGGPDAIARGGWHWAGGWDRDHWDYDWDIDVPESRGPVATRTFPWDGSDRLSLSIPADVTYTQADGPAQVVVTGPQRLLDRMSVEDGRIRVRKAGWGVRKVQIAVTAPQHQPLPPVWRQPADHPRLQSAHPVGGRLGRVQDRGARPDPGARHRHLGRRRGRDGSAGHA
ncbi:DUF2807 domain-containing protein [Phenylobacterium sp. J426]|uniref:DUF2807 domain-containing protein n=1 Tax=Phenylobacterium sp. J426 TaxID=2898439 RepID=UPI002150A5FC|nr:DUF2807 domain-containing protein [Phenylobacterium sp. J426]MCR5875743.1 DUF2807 domain-containing protein [Phenylobacterium sp. J426]